MALKLLGSMYLAFAGFMFLVLIAPGNAKKMFFWSDSRMAGFLAAVHAWVTWSVMVTCGIFAWALPGHAATLAWALVATAGVGHILVALVGRRAVCARCLMAGAVIQTIAAIAVTLAAD